MFLISSYGTPLTQRASYLAQHNSYFGPDGTVNYDYIVTHSINFFLFGLNPMGHTLIIVEPMWPIIQKLSKTPYILTSAWQCLSDLRVFLCIKSHNYMDTEISRNQGDVMMPNYHHPYLVPLRFIHLSSLHHFDLRRNF